MLVLKHVPFQAIVNTPRCIGRVFETTIYKNEGEMLVFNEREYVFFST